MLGFIVRGVSVLFRLTATGQAETNDEIVRGLRFEFSGKTNINGGGDHKEASFHSQTTPAALNRALC